MGSSASAHSSARPRRRRRKAKGVPARAKNDQKTAGLGFDSNDATTFDDVLQWGRKWATNNSEQLTRWKPAVSAYIDRHGGFLSALAAAKGTLSKQISEYNRLKEVYAQRREVLKEYDKLHGEVRARVPYWSTSSVMACMDPTLLDVRFGAAPYDEAFKSAWARRAEQMKSSGQYIPRPPDTIVNEALFGIETIPNSLFSSVFGTNRLAVHMKNCHRETKAPMEFVSIEPDTSQFERKLPKMGRECLLEMSDQSRGVLICDVMKLKGFGERPTGPYSTIREQGVGDRIIEQAERLFPLPPCSAVTVQSGVVLVGVARGKLYDLVVREKTSSQLGSDESNWKIHLETNQDEFLFSDLERFKQKAKSEWIGKTGR